MKSTETLIQWERFRRGLSKPCGIKGIWGVPKILLIKSTVALGLIIKDPCGWESQSAQDLKQPLPKGPGYRPLLALQSIFLVSRKELILLYTSGPQGKLPRARMQAVIGSTGMFQGLRRSYVPSAYIRASWKASLEQASPRHTILSFCNDCHPVSCCPFHRTILFVGMEVYGISALNICFDPGILFEHLLRGLLLDQGSLFCYGLQPHAQLVLVNIVMSQHPNP